MDTDKIIEACLELSSKQHDGCLFVIEPDGIVPRYYKDYNIDIFKKNNKRLSVLREKDRQVIRILAGLDGAVIISSEGDVLHYGATLTYSQKLIGHGKRHAFALGTSKHINGSICILASEEDSHVRSFRDGVCVVDIDSRTKLSATTRQKVANLLDTPLTKTLIVSGIATSVLTLNPIPAIITISGGYLVVSEGFSRLRDYFTKK